MKGGHEEGGKAFRSLSAPPSRMPRRICTWLLGPAMYIHIHRYSRTHTKQARILSRADASARMRVYSWRISNVRARGGTSSDKLLPRISKRDSKQLKDAFTSLSNDVSYVHQKTILQPTYERTTRDAKLNRINFL